MSSLLEVRNISFGYPGNPVLDSVSFTATNGEFIVLMGLNGAGKSTLLDILAGLRRPDSGEATFRGRSLFSWPSRERCRQISHLPQGTRKELSFSVEQMVLMGRYAHADRWFESKEDHTRAEDAMLRMDCLQFRDRLFSTLSGGEQQRVLLAACVAQSPRLMLFDEPSAFLDVHQQVQCFSTLALLAGEGALCIAVTHDLNLALTHANRALVLDHGNIAADFATHDAARNTDWLSLLSPCLRLAHAPDGKPWVLYR